MSGVIRIPLGASGHYALVDREDFAKVKGLNWSANRYKNRRGRVYAQSHVDGVTVLMHRLLMNARSGDVIAHMNMDTLDNTRGNLRMTTRSLASSLRIIGTTNTTGHKGVTVDRARGCYRGVVFVEGVRTRKRFGSVAEAAAWVASTRAELLGDFA